MNRLLDRSSSVPLYSQIKEILIHEMRDIDKVSELVLTENTLMKRFQVSRAPIRQALKEMEDEGYVVRHRAKGTFPVRRLNVSLPPAMELGGISKYLAEQGLKSNSRIVGLERVEAPEEVTEALGLGKSAKMLHLKRVIFVKGTPLAWVSSYLYTPPDFFPEIEELERLGSVFGLIERKLGLKFTKGTQNIWASGANEEEAEALELSVGTPVLVAETTMYTDDGQPGGWRRAVHRAEDFKYSFGLGG
ncbi:GntR family transcriptional regulator [Marinobacterium mangrovicola]|uniref:GntR family transcriptional regulator n=1 Tax=Marinobacterium mangrovicola TaxID=1476959 RepID=A0A4R1G8Q6_9GAMM|nr:GntR family transcriptional regulator [Marinobacterium mangrovicola]TCK02950.1 GntR family transcriptional regulator [Marinobacterium mangrovicola]